MSSGARSVGHGRARARALSVFVPVCAHWRLKRLALPVLP